MSALTLVEAAKLAANNGETKRSAIIELYASASDIWGALRIEGITGNAYSYTQEGELPTVAFRGVNEAYTASNGNFNPQKVALTIAGGDLDVDKFIIDTQGMESRSRHEALKVKALSQSMTDTVMNGDSSTEPREFDGLQSLCTGGQLIDNGSTSGGDPLSLAKLDQAIDNTASPSHLIMSRTMRRRLWQSTRSTTSGVGGNVLMEREEMGKPILTYAGLPILTGYEKNKNTAILPFTESSPGGGSTGTSIYVVNLTSDDGLLGISNGGMQVRDLGELDTAPVFRTRVEYYMSLVALGPYAATRLWGISDAAVAA